MASVSVGGGGFLHRKEFDVHKTGNIKSENLENKYSVLYLGGFYPPPSVANAVIVTLDNTSLIITIDHKLAHPRTRTKIKCLHHQFSYYLPNLLDSGLSSGVSSRNRKLLYYCT
jgi:hypothetical protein